MEVEKLIYHEDYNPNTLQHDIGLIMLKKSLDSTYMPVCLAPKLKDYTGKEVSVIGWGNIADNNLGIPCTGTSSQGSMILCDFLPTFCLIPPSGSVGIVQF